MTWFGAACALFCIGYDSSSYSIMKKIDPLYKKKYRLFLGYNTFKVWQSYRKAVKNGDT